MEKGKFPSEQGKFRHNYVTRDDWENVICDPNSTRLLEWTRDMPLNPPPDLVGSSGN